MREQLNFGGIAAYLRDLLNQAWAAASDYESALMISGFDEEIDASKEMLQGSIEQCYVQVAFLLELLDLQSLLKEFRSGFDNFRNDLTAVEISAIGEAYPVALEYVQTYALTALSAGGVESELTVGIQRPERILLGTAKIVADRGIKPSRETEVRNAVYAVLLHIFPDTVREVPISKVSKSFKPNIGVPSLKAAVEYKFVDSDKEFKNAVGGVYEDILGYGGSEDWKTFFAVFYMTDAYRTQAQVEAEFRLSGVEHSWKPILVVGQGARERGARRADL